MMRESTSRPSSSVPNQCAELGDCSREGRSMAAGSLGAITGANTANRTNTLTITMPAIARRLRRPSAVAVVQVVVRFTGRILEELSKIAKIAGIERRNPISCDPNEGLGRNSKPDQSNELKFKFWHLWSRPSGSTFG